MSMPAVSRWRDPVSWIAAVGLLVCLWQLDVPPWVLGVTFVGFGLCHFLLRYEASREADAAAGRPDRLHLTYLILGEIVGFAVWWAVATLMVNIALWPISRRSGGDRYVWPMLAWGAINIVVINVQWLRRQPLLPLRFVVLAGGFLIAYVGWLVLVVR